MTKYITGIIGAMSAGKSKLLIHKMMGKNCESILVAHTNNTQVESRKYNCIATPTFIVEKLEDLRLDDSVEAVFIDEAHFFGDLVKFIEENKFKFDIIFAGLQYNFRGERFEDLDEALNLCNQVCIMKAPCFSCGALGEHSARLGSNDQQDILVNKDVYKPSCLKCLKIDA